MVCSCESFFTATLAAGAGANVAVPGLPSTAGGGAPGVAGPGVAGAVCPGRLAGVGWTGGFGPKNFAQRMITANDNSEATRIRSSGVNLSFCPGALMSAPQSRELSVRLNLLAFLPISPEPGRNQICARADGSAAAASVQAKSRAPRQTFQWPRRHSANMSVRIDNFLRTRSTNTFCRTAARAAPRAQESSAPHFAWWRFV